MKRPATWLIAVFIIAEVTFTQTDYSVIENGVPLSIGEVNAIYPVSRTPSDISRVHYVLHGEDQVYFVDEAFSPLDSMTVKEGTRTRIRASHNNHYFLLTEILTYADFPFSGGERMNTLIDYMGRVYYRKTELISGDEIYISKFLLSGIDGVLYELDGYNSKVLIWKNDGSLAREIRLFEEGSSVRRGSFSLTEDDQYLVVLKQRLPAEQGGEPHLFLFNSEGNLVRETILEYDFGVDILVQDSEHAIVCQVSDYDLSAGYLSAFYDFNLEKLFEVVASPILVKFFNDNLYVVHNDSRALYLSKYNWHTGSNSWTHEILDFPAGRVHRVEDIAFLDSSRQYIGLHLLKRYNPVGRIGRTSIDRDNDVYILQIIRDNDASNIRELELGDTAPAFKFNYDRTYASSISIDVNQNIRTLAVEED